jgi:hypothetical protein
MRTNLIIPHTFVGLNFVITFYDFAMALHSDNAVSPLCPPTQSLFEAVDDLSKMYMSESWIGSLKFRCLLVSRDMIEKPLDKTSIELVDICTYLGPSTSRPSLARLYLDPQKYDKPPIDREPLVKNAHWNQLKDELEAAAHSSGSPIMCNGGRANRTFKCKLRNRLYRPKLSRKAGPPRQDDCINMDKGGRRPQGRSESKRTRTTQALTSDELCPFRFTVKWDSFGFYITVEKKGFGCPHHANHLKGDLSKLSLPMQLIPENEKDILRSMSSACIGSAVGRNYVFSKLGKFINSAQIAYFTSEPDRALVDGMKKSDTDSLLEFFESTEDISYHTLWDVPLDNGSTALISTLNVDRELGFAEIDHTDDPDFIEPRESATVTRTNPRVHKNARIFMAVAWANKFDIRTFSLFPEVFHCDCTCDTNNTNNHLLTFSCRTSTGKQIVFLRIWIPNQKRFTFRWVFKFVLPSLFDVRIFLRTRLVMVDGDPQQKGEISKAITVYMPNAMDGGCGWHIVFQGWKAHGPGKTAVVDVGGKREKYNLFKKRVKAWCYSWMTPGGVELEEEYSVSKQLLFAYLASEEVLDACDGQQYIIDQVSTFVLNYVIVYDEVFLFFKKKFVRYFNVKTSSAHEGTNFAIKEHAAAVLPSHRINVAGERLSLQSTMKGTQLEAESTYMASSQSLWSKSRTSNHVTTLAESILSRAHTRTHDYSVNRTAIDSWEVRYVGHDDYSFETDRRPINRNDPIPIFKRIRIVEHHNDFLCCDCGAQQRLGLTCVHTMAVMETCFPCWEGPTHHDVSPRWWITWLEFGYKPNTQNITTAMLALMENEVPGPRIPGPVPGTDSYCRVTDEKTAICRVKNYSLEQLRRLVPTRQVIREGNARRTTIIEEGLTQESYLVTNNNSSDPEEDDEDAVVNNNYPSDQEDDDDEEAVDDNLFATSLLEEESSTIALTSAARDILKPQINEVLQCLDTLKSESSMQMASKVLSDLANQLRLQLANSSGPKRNIENCLTVNMNVEENASKKSRTYASRNC